VKPNVAVLGEVANFLRGVTYKPADLVPNFATNSVVCFRTANVQKTLDQSDLLSIGRNHIKGDAKLLIEGDILVSTANSWNLVGKCCWVPSLSYRATFGGFIAALRADTARVDSRYLYHWFNSPRTQTNARNCGRQTTNISNMDIGRCLELEIPLPALAEQRRIAAILDKAASLRAKRRLAIAKLDQLLQSVVLEMFGDPVTNPKNWTDVFQLGGVAEIVSGITKGRRTNETVRTVPYLTVANVQDRHLRLETVKGIEATESEIARYTLNSNDLLLTEGGDPDKLGRGALWRGELPECIHQNHVFRVRLTSPLFNPVYLSWIVGSTRGKQYFFKAAKQTTGIASINMTQLKGFPLLSPPVELQNKFANLVDEVGRRRLRMISADRKTNALLASLQHKAFGCDE
jgi:type I restriction enzyme S subunit